MIKFNTPTKLFGVEADAASGVSAGVGYSIGVGEGGVVSKIGLAGVGEVD